MSCSTVILLFFWLFELQILDSKTWRLFTPFSPFPGPSPLSSRFTFLHIVSSLHPILWIPAFNTIAQTLVICPDYPVKGGPGGAWSGIPLRCIIPRWGQESEWSAVLGLCFTITANSGPLLSERHFHKGRAEKQVLTGVRDSRGWMRSGVWEALWDQGPRRGRTSDLESSTLKDRRQRKRAGCCRYYWAMNSEARLWQLLRF